MIGNMQRIPGAWPGPHDVERLPPLPPSARLDVGRIEAVIFDMDDTLLNWRQAEHGAIGDLARLHFVPAGIAEADVRMAYDVVMAENYAAWKATRTWWYIADRLKLLVQRLGAAENVPVQQLVATFGREVTLRLDWLDGGLAAVRAARENGRKTALLTNGKGEVQRPKVRAFGLDRELDFVGITGELGAWKPDHEAFRLVLKPLGIKPENALMVGDNLDFDIEPAKALGMQTAWVSPGPESNPLADVVIPSPGALIPHLTRRG